MTNNEAFAKAIAKAGFTEQAVALMMDVALNGTLTAADVSAAEKLSGAVPPPRDRARIAVCVGINYVGQNALRGCVNDANDWAAELRKRSFDVTTLLDRQATKAGILSALGSVIASASKFLDAVVVVTYSGHGSHVPDHEGDEPDGEDECWIPWDHESNGVILDDDLGRILDAVQPHVRVVVVSDSCHSGSMSRDVETESRFLPPDVVFPEGWQTPARAPWSRWRDRAGDSGPPAVLLSGCQDDETSADARINGRYCGAMSNAALATLGSARTYKDWITAILRTMAGRFRQHPQLSGRASLLGGKVFE